MNGDIEAAKKIISAGGDVEHADKVNIELRRLGKLSSYVIQRQIAGRL